MKSRRIIMKQALRHGIITDGYLSIFNEVDGAIVDLIGDNLIVNDKTIPYIRVDRCWADHWRALEIEDKFGGRVP